MHGLNMYDYSARYMDPAIGRFTTVDPLAEKYYSISPYAYCANNPIKYIDPTGMAYGDFENEKGEIIGNDGINDGKLYVVKTTKTSFDSNVSSAGITKTQKKTTEKFIKDNTGNTDAFQSNSIAYDNSVELVGTVARQAMVDEVSKDNGKGGTSDANNREYGGSVNSNGTVAVATPGAVADPSADLNASITLPANKVTFHSHPSGIKTVGNTTFSFNQAPSPSADIPEAGSHTQYVFARGEGKVYIHNSQGVQATLPHNRFVNPKR